MKKLARFAAVAVAGSVLAISGAGVAAANTTGPSNEAVGQQVLQLRDQVAQSMQAGNAQNTKSSVDQLTGVVGDFAQSGARSDLTAIAAQARDQGVQTSQALTAPAEARQSLPSLPNASVLTDLVNSLLSTVGSLLSGLLSVLPVPTPSLPSVPGVPSVPGAPSAPSVPGAPSAPSLPSVPGVPSVPSVPGLPTAG